MGLNTSTIDQCLSGRNSLEADRELYNNFTSQSAVKRSPARAAGDVESPPIIDGYNPHPALKATMSRYLNKQADRLSMPRAKREKSSSKTPLASPFKGSKIFNGSQQALEFLHRKSMTTMSP
jgi:hypothetical protein